MRLKTAADQIGNFAETVLQNQFGKVAAEYGTHTPLPPFGVRNPHLRDAAIKIADMMALIGCRAGRQKSGSRSAMSSATMLIVGSTRNNKFLRLRFPAAAVLAAARAYWVTQLAIGVFAVRTCLRLGQIPDGDV